ncbi:MAG: hypothetical protein ACOX21_00890 [Bacillota bacterium]|nr:hypothetical protein [Bacillota bacterium]HOC07025.1 DUF4878 domain-containing protein [Bacillota bacterium]HPZ23120.1 DUF4878 domain-containing protein [Bacillota bacterium]
MTEPKDSRNKRLTYIITGAVTLVLTLVVLAATFSPPTPENAVTGMLDSFVHKDVETLEKYVHPSVLESVQAQVSVYSDSLWQVFWQDGDLLFEHYNVDEAVINGDEAVVTVYYGPGLIQADDFLLRREGRNWKVYDVKD